MAGAADRVHRSFASLQDDSYFLSGGAAGGSRAQQARSKAERSVRLQCCASFAHYGRGWIAMRWPTFRTPKTKPRDVFGPGRNLSSYKLIIGKRRLEVKVT